MGHPKSGALLRFEPQQKRNQAVPKKVCFFAGNWLHRHGPLAKEV
jgi:hypothetical protein